MKRWTVGRTVLFVIMVVFSFLCIWPVFWVALSSLKTDSELFANPWGLPEQIVWGNYSRAWIRGNIGQGFINALFITLVSIAVSLLLVAMTSYGLVRLRWKLSGVVKTLFLLGMSIPAYASIIPLFSMYNSLRLLNTYTGIILLHVVFAFPISIFILTGYISTIPHELEEAALMDGCTILKQFFLIIMPVSLSSLVTVAVINFNAIWNDLLFAQIYLSDSAKMPIAVGLTNFSDIDSTDYVGMLAAIMITIMPTILVYLFLHDKIIEGMTAGAVKG